MTMSAADYADPRGWAARGACRDSDPELFFPVTSRGPGRGQIEQAKAICARCAVQDQCLEFAVESGQSFGVWGGKAEDERLTLRRNRLRRRRRMLATRS